MTKMQLDQANKLDEEMATIDKILIDLEVSYGVDNVELKNELRLGVKRVDDIYHTYTIPKEIQEEIVMLLAKTMRDKLKEFENL